MELKLVLPSAKQILFFGFKQWFECECWGSDSYTRSIVY